MLNKRAFNLYQGFMEHENDFRQKEKDNMFKSRKLVPKKEKKVNNNLYLFHSLEWITNHQ